MKSDPDFYDTKIAGWWVWGLCLWIGSGWCQTPRQQIPHLGNNGRGVHRKLPHLGDNGRGADIYEYFAALSDRLRRVRIACGDWSRILGDSPTTKLGLTSILLDPPYQQFENLYSAPAGDISGEVRQWAIEHGNNPLLRIALCGYADEHAMPDDWECVEWKAAGGYGSQRRDRANQNSAKERIWFSPYCLHPRTSSQLDLLSAWSPEEGALAL